jgi:hypothetical protein
VTTHSWQQTKKEKALAELMQGFDYLLEAVYNTDYDFIYSHKSNKGIAMLTRYKQKENISKVKPT